MTHPCGCIELIFWSNIQDSSITEHEGSCRLLEGCKHNNSLFMVHFITQAYTHASPPPPYWHTQMRVHAHTHTKHIHCWWWVGRKEKKQINQYAEVNMASKLRRCRLPIQWRILPGLHRSTNNDNNKNAIAVWSVRSAWHRTHEDAVQ